MKRIRVLALVLVFAFAALGGAYAAWSDSIFINETVDTGIVDITWANAESSDNPGTEGYKDRVYVGIWPFGYWKTVCVPGTDGDPDAQAEGYYNEEDLSVASKTADIKDEIEDDLPGAYVDGKGDILEITLENGYPGYTATVTADIKNIGTIPVKCTFAENVAVTPWMKVRIVDADTNDEYWNSESPNASGVTPTIEPDKSIKVKIIEEVLDQAPQNSTSTFSIKVKGTQWNTFQEAV